MQVYETKIINQSGKLSFQIAEAHLSDLAAVRAARKLCGDGKSIEIWQDDMCVYRGRLRPAHLVWPVHPEKAAS